MGKYGFSVFVGNLSRRVRRDDLKDTFRDMGRVIEVDIKTGYGTFVHKVIFRLLCRTCDN